MNASPMPGVDEPAFLGVVPILFVRDIERAAAFYADRLGFKVDFLYGSPPFYGSVSRGSSCLHLRLVHAESHFPALAKQERSLILASIEVRNVKGLFEEYDSGGVQFAQRLINQAWGGTDFHVRDIDGNVIAFVEYHQTAS